MEFRKDDLMLILSTTKYAFECRTKGLYKFRRKGKYEWILVDQAKLIDPETGFVKYFDCLKETAKSSQSKQG